MKLPRCGIAFAILCFVANSSAFAQGESLNDKLQREIVDRMVEFNNAGRADELVGQKFYVYPPQGMRIHNIEILPENAFSKPIRQQDGSLIIQIVNAKPLFINKAGTKTPARIRVIISTLSEGQGDIILDSSSACINTLSYSQVGNEDMIQIGDLLVDPDYEVNWEYPPDKLKQGEIRGNWVTFTRIGAGPASVVFVVRSKGTGKVQKVRNDIPECKFEGDPPPPPPPIDNRPPPPPPKPRTIWLGAEASIGSTGRVGIDMVRHSDGPLFKIGAFLDYHLANIDEDVAAMENSTMSYGLRVGAGWRFGKNTLLLQFPVALSNRDSSLRFGGELAYAREIKGYFDLQLAAGGTVIEGSGAGLVVVGGVVFHLGRPSQSGPLAPPPPPAPAEPAPTGFNPAPGQGLPPL